jgi:tetratricopeptide (TPR) repeat protein
VVIILCSWQIYAQGAKFFKSGIAKYKTGDFMGAAHDFEAAINYDKSNFQAYRWKGDSEQSADQFNQSILSYSKAIAIAERDTLSFKGRAFSYAMIGKFEEALKDYNKAIELNPKDDDLYFGRATSNYKTHQYKKSIADYSVVIKRHPRFELSYIRRAISYVELEQYEEAKKDIKKYFQLGGKDDAAYYFRGLVNTRLGSDKPLLLDSAIADLVRYTQSKDEAKRKDPMAFQTLGTAYSKKRDSTNSRKNFKISLQLDSTNANTYFRWGSSELTFRNPKKADELISQARTMTNSPSKSLLLNLGIAKSGVGDTTSAINNFTEALKQDSTFYDAYEYRAVFLFDNHKYTRMVLSDLQHMIELSHENIEKAEGHSLKSMVAMHVNDTLTAKQEVDKAIQIMPEEPFHYMTRAFLNANLGKNQSIIFRDVDKALSLDPNVSEAYLFKATYYSKHGDHKNGCESLKNALRTGSNVSKEIQDYICKGKKPKNGKVPELFIPVGPRLKKMTEDYEN